MFIFENHVKAAGKRECKRTKFESNTSPKHGLYSRETETIYWNQYLILFSAQTRATSL